MSSTGKVQHVEHPVYLPLPTLYVATGLRSEIKLEKLTDDLWLVLQSSDIHILSNIILNVQSKRCHHV